MSVDCPCCLPQLMSYMRGYRKLCQRGSNFDVFFLFIFFLIDEGREDKKYHYKRAIIGPPAKRHLLNGVC